jgi:hypothetical protein
MPKNRVEKNRTAVFSIFYKANFDLLLCRACNKTVKVKLLSPRQLCRGGGLNVWGLRV